MSFTDNWDIRPTPADGAVIKGEGYRITVLTDRLLRLEYEPGTHWKYASGSTNIVVRYLRSRFPEVRR